MEKNAFAIGVMTLLLFFLGFLLKPTEVGFGFILTIGLLSFFLTFINLKLGLFILVFMIPLSTQFNLGMVGKGPIDIATDDVIVLSIIVGWLGYLALTKEPLFKRSPLNMPFFGYFLVSLLSLLALGAKFPQNVVVICLLHIFKWFEYVLIYFIIISTIKTKEELKFYTFAFMTSCILVAISQVAMVISGHITGKFTYGVYAVPFGFESNGIVAGYYLFFISIILAMVLKVVKGASRLFWICASLLVSYALFTSFSRAVYLGIMVSSFILCVVLDRRFLTLIVILAILVPVVIFPAVSKRIAITTTRVNEKTELDLSSKERLINWQIALREIKKQPILGMGFWGVRYSGLFGFSTVHSQYLTVLLETGLLGLIFFFFIFYRIFKLAIFTYRNSTDIFIKSLNMGFLAGLAGILVQSIFGEAFDSTRITGPLWFMTGIIVLSNQFLKEEGDKKP